MNRRNAKNKPASPANSAAADLADRTDTRGQAAGEQAQIRKELGAFERISIRIQVGMLCVTVIVTIVTTAYVAVTYRQLQVMRVQSAASDESMRLDERAWIGITRVGISEFKAGLPPTIVVEVVNHGKTPAKNLKVKFYVADIAVGKPIPMYDFSAHRATGRNGSNLIFPNVTAKMLGTFMDETGKPISLTAEGIKSFYEGRGVIYTVGRIDYQDVFNRPHWATFCFVSVPTTPEDFTVCESGNDSD